MKDEIGPLDWKVFYTVPPSIVGLHDFFDCSYCEEELREILAKDYPEREVLRVARVGE